MLVEVRQGANVYYMRADCPDAEVLDARAMYFEKKYASARTPAALFATIPSIPPTVTDVIAPVDVDAGRYRLVSTAWCKELPVFKWGDIWSFASGAASASGAP